MEVYVSSVAKALSILDCFKTSQPELSLAQISQQLELPKSTALNQIRTLESLGYLYKVNNTQNYRLGYKIMELNYCAHTSMPIVQYAVPIMSGLQRACGDNVYLTSHIDGRVFYLECMYQNDRSIAYSDAGKTLPMHCTSCGKAMLSYMPPETVDAIIDRWGLGKVTPNTHTDRDSLMRDLALCRERGYAVDNEEESVGVRCIAAAIRTPMGDVAGALSISGSSVTMSDQAVLDNARLLLNAANALKPQAQLFPAIQLLRED